MIGHPAVFETIGDEASSVPLVLTCEHASNALPEWTPRADEQAILADHYGWDVGAADLTRQLNRALGGVAVLSSFSRLVCDPNREPDEASFVVDRIGDTPLSWNRGVDARERRRRRDRYYAPYHREIDRVLTARRAAGLATRLCSVHSFTPFLDGERREMEVGVLFDAHEAVADRVLRHLVDAGIRAVPNAPYSGYAGLIHAARRHGRRHGIVYIEIEVRQDLIDTPVAAARVASRIAPAIAELTEDASP